MAPSTKKQQSTQQQSGTVDTKKIGSQKPPPIDKLLIPAIGIALALMAYQFFKGINAEIQRVNLEDEVEVREVFFGDEGSGKSYVVLCHKEDSKLPLSSVFQDAYKDGSAPAEFRIMDCDYILPDSGKSITERFKFDMKQRPTIFISGSKIDGEPQQIPSKHLKTGAMLVKVLKNKLEPRAAKIDTTQDLRSKCLDKDICALLLKGSKKAPTYLKDAIAKLLVEYPKVTVAAMDSSIMYAKNLEEFLPALADEQPRFVVFKKVSGSIDPKGERLISSIAPLSTNGVSYGQMSTLIGSVISNTAKMEKIPVLPTLAIRTKKIEKEDQAKRDRKLNRDQPKTSSPSSSSSTFTGDNDGTRDGRRAERERRRTEHQRSHNVKPKTPEEVAEMERQRRIRMEEEAKKWNMAPEDLPPEGEPMQEDTYNMDAYEDDNQDLGNNDEDEEDVMDLD